MKSISFLSTYSLDEPVLRNRITPFIDLALERGFSVTLVNPEGGEYHQAEHIGYTHRSIEVSQANRGNFLVRTLREIALSRKVLKNSPKDADVVFVTIPSMFLLFLFNKGKENVSVLDVRDLTWEYLNRFSVITRVARAVFRHLAKIKVLEFDFISVTNNAEQRYLHNHFNIPLGKIELCPNGISNQQFKQVSGIDAGTEPVSAGEFSVVYVGNVGVAQNLTTLVSASKLLPDVSFSVVGAGSDFERVKKAAQACNNIKFLGRLSWEEIPEIYEGADILWAQLSLDFSGAVPSKLYEYLATGKSVIYGGVGEARSVFSGFENLHFIEPENVDALASKIQTLRSLPKAMPISYKNKNEIKKNYIREHSVDRLYRKIFKG